MQQRKGRAGPCVAIALTKWRGADASGAEITSMVLLDSQGKPQGGFNVAPTFRTVKNIGSQSGDRDVGSRPYAGSCSRSASVKPESRKDPKIKRAIP